MKRNQLSALLFATSLAMTLLFAAPRAVWAVTFAYDPFLAGGATPDTAAGEYETGTGYTGDFIDTQAPTVSGFVAGPWTAAGGYASFVYYRTEPGQLGYVDSNSRELFTSPGQLNLFRSSGASATDKDMSRDLSIGNSLPGNLYISTLVQVSSGASLAVRSASTDGGSDRRFSFGIDAAGNPFVAGTGGGSGTDTNTGVTVDPNTAHLLVAKLTDDGFASDQIDLFLDPILDMESSNTPVATIDGGNFYVAGNASWSLKDIFFRDVVPTAPASIVMDEVRVATTWDDAVPNFFLGSVMSVDAITTDNPDSLDPNRADTPANLTSVTFGNTTFKGDNLVPVTDVSTTNTTGVYVGNVDPGKPVTATVSDVFTDLDITTGKANAVDMNLFFETPFEDKNGTLPNVAILELTAGSQSDSWTVEAIVGGTPGSPIFGGTPLTFTQNAPDHFADTGHQVGVTRQTDVNPLNQDIYGIGLDFAALGLVAGVDTLYGVRVVTTGGDPNVVVGVSNLPEPSTLLLVGLGGFGLTLRRRRRRQ